MPARPFEIQHLDHLVLRTTGQDALVAFYESLGCHVVRKLEKWVCVSCVRAHP